MQVLFLAQKKNLQTKKRRRDKTIEQQAATIIAQLPSIQCNNDRIIATSGVQHFKKAICSKSKPRTTWWLQKGDFLVGTKNTSHESWFTPDIGKGCTSAAQWKLHTGKKRWRCDGVLQRMHTSCTMKKFNRKRVKTWSRINGNIVRRWRQATQDHGPKNTKQGKGLLQNCNQPTLPGR